MKVAVCRNGKIYTGEIEVEVINDELDIRGAARPTEFKCEPGGSIRIFEDYQLLAWEEQS